MIVRSIAGSGSEIQVQLEGKKLASWGQNNITISIYTISAKQCTPEDGQRLFGRNVVVIITFIIKMKQRV